MAADARPAVDGGPESPQIPELGVENGGGLEDGLAFPHEAVLVAGGQDHRRDDGEPEAAAGGVQEADLRMDLQVTGTLVREVE